MKIIEQDDFMDEINRTNSVEEVLRMFNLSR
ncbi:mannitol/fructose-specific phosphotransferase system IIA component (Ntr-type) [Clostridium beijerinckii]|nr:mannitol/fructose-specific phosphotransferase system IIA component (Ntr-type) [Clostridium beijerinckii]